KVDEHPLTGGVNLPQRRLQTANPFPVELTEPGEPKSVLSPCSAAVFFPQQRQRHVRSPQFAMHDRPVWNRTLLRRRGRRWRIEQRLQLRVVEFLGQRPTQPRPTSATETPVHRTCAQSQTL